MTPLKSEIKTMNLDQLNHIKRFVEGCIKERAEEKKVALWVVIDLDLNINCAAFRENEFDKAVKILCAEIKGTAQRCPDENIMFQLKKSRFFESEVNGMLELGQWKDYIKYERERCEGVKCNNNKCIFHDDKMELCCSGESPCGSSAVESCQKYIPEVEKH